MVNHNELLHVPTRQRTSNVAQIYMTIMYTKGGSRPSSKKLVNLFSNFIPSRKRTIIGVKVWITKVKWQPKYVSLTEAAK